MGFDCKSKFFIKVNGILRQLIFVSQNLHGRGFDFSLVKPFNRPYTLAICILEWRGFLRLDRVGSLVFYGGNNYMEAGRLCLRVEVYGGMI